MLYSCEMYISGECSNDACPHAFEHLGIVGCGKGYCQRKKVHCGCIEICEDRVVDNSNRKEIEMITMLHRVVEKRKRLRKAAIEIDLPIWTATQQNRINKKKGIEMKKIDWFDHSNRKEIKEAHKTLFKNCGIKEGDTVRVLRKADGGEWGWPEIWTNEMDAAIGKEFVVEEPKDSIRWCSFKCNNWYFPFFVLKKIKDATPIIKLTIDGKEIELSKETTENILQEL